jgi:hypothetical protein
MATRQQRNPLGNNMSLKSKQEALEEIRAMDKEIEEEIEMHNRDLNKKDFFE